MRPQRGQSLYRSLSVCFLSFTCDDWWRSIAVSAQAA
jgi:hypothetical protein